MLRETCLQQMHAHEMHARALFPLRCPSTSDPGCGAPPEALTTPAEEEHAEEEQLEPFHKLLEDVSEVSNSEV
jgi:hypothetical protein